MSNLLLPRRFYSQPQGAVQINWSNPLTSGLHDAFLPDSEVISGVLAISGLGKAAAPIGVGIKNTSSTATHSYTCDASPQTTRCTVLVYAQRDGTQPDSGFGKVFALDQVSGLQDPFHLFIKDSGERVRWNTTTMDTTDNAETTTNWPIGVPQVGVYLYRSGQNAQCYRNGVLQTLSVNTLGSKTGSLKPSNSATVNSSGLRFNGVFFLGIVWNRDLSALEVASISANPWQIFKVSE